MLLGIDVGGTHTDAVLVDETGLRAWAKARTRHDDLLVSIREVLGQVLEGASPDQVVRLNLSTTLSTNAIVQGLTESVGVFVSGGPGVAPRAHLEGPHGFVLPGSVDHRGRVVAQLPPGALTDPLAICASDGVRVYAAVGKFSTRNPEIESTIRDAVSPQADFVSLGHEFSGQLGFPRRIHTASLNASVWRVFNTFLGAVEECAQEMGLRAQVNILKADGGTMPLGAARGLPVESILSGPAASVMGIIALCDITEDCAILDIGGTTTDIGVFAEGAPLIEPDGAVIADRPTLVRALTSTSIGVGGDSAIAVEGGEVLVGPRRFGPAMAEGGDRPTLVDALNVAGVCSRGDAEASARGIGELAAKAGMAPAELASRAAHAAVASIRKAVDDMVESINRRPVYTIHELLEGKQVRPVRFYVMGGPAEAMSGLLSEAFGQGKVVVPPNFTVANALGAALSRPTLAAELFADTAQGRMLVPAFGVEEAVDNKYSLDQAKDDARRILAERLDRLGLGADQAPIDTVQAQSFNMIEGSRMTGKNIRVKCQIRPGVLPGYGRVAS